ncbi:twin-arginine translocase subunit TatC [Halomontanus rarus]|uniref:twin-arginine translocase subunit TatC n=1 Tax=Halomontanus rarus TaxID=3034020 RepID=UPI0023E81360|nr:twin-arginine translocase subunit TatC [Halovivax sp. TS33]
MPDESDEGADVDGSEEPREDAGEQPPEGHTGESPDSSRGREDTIETDGEGYVHDRPDSGTGDSEYPEPDPDDDIGGISTPPDDEEMPLADHIEEMILRLARVILVGSAATAIGLFWASEAIEFIWFNVFPGPVDEVPPPHVYHPLELWLSRIKVAALAGVLVALPMFVYECYAFMRPGLYPNERKYYISAVPMSLVLAAFGMFVSYILVLPILFRYFTYYSDASANIAYGLGNTFDMIITLTGFLAVVFQIPLFIMLAIMMGVTTRKWLADKRLYFWAAFLGLSFMFTLDPTGMAPIIVAIIMIVLFEGTLLVLKWVGRE